MSCRITCIRHVQRIKGSGKAAEEQRLSEAGMLTAWVMGHVIRTKLGENFQFPQLPIPCSPQLRSVRSTLVLLNALHGDSTESREFDNKFEVNDRLSDYSHDPRHEIKEGLAAARVIELTNAIDVEQAMFLCSEGIETVMLKVGEAYQVVNTVTNHGMREGHFLFSGLHGCTIDGLHVWMLLRMGAELPMGTGAAGGLFNYGEGFSFLQEPDEANLGTAAFAQMMIFRQPPHLRAALAAMGE